MKKGVKCKKLKVYSRVFHVTFFTFRTPFFTFRILRYGQHSRKKSKDFVVYFFAALIKHEIHMKCEKCTVSTSYFMVCFAKTLAKCGKCIAGLTVKERLKTGG